MGKQAIERAYEITDAKITFVSLVDAAANKKTFLITKAKDGQAEIKLTGKILRQDQEKHLVTGVVYAPMEEDTWGTFMNAEEIEKAAHWFMRNGSRNSDIQHSFEPNRDCSVVESWIARSDEEMGGETVKAGTWLMTVEIADSDIWGKITRGEITGLSMGGVGTYSEEDTDLDTIEKSDAAEKRGLLTRLAEFLGMSPIERGEMADMYAERRKTSAFWEAFSSLEDTLRKYDYREDKYIYETDEGKIRDALTDFEAILHNILTSEQPIAMSVMGPATIEKSKKEDTEVTKEQLEEAINRAAELAVEKLTKAEGESAEATAATETPAETAEAPAAEATPEQTPEGESNDGGESADAPITRADIEKMIADAIEKAAAPKEDALTPETVTDMVNRAVEKAVEPVLKHVGTPGNLNGDSVERSSEGQHYLHGIL